MNILEIYHHCHWRSNNKVEIWVEWEAGKFWILWLERNTMGDVGWLRWNIKIARACVCRQFGSSDRYSHSAGLRKLESAVSVSLPVTQAQEPGLSHSQGLGSLLFSYVLSWRISFTQVVLLQFINRWFSNVSSKIDCFSELQMRPFLWCLTALQNQYAPHGIPYLSPLHPPPNTRPVPDIQLLSFL